MSGWREAIREITGEQSEPMLKKVSPSEAFSTMDRDMGASQPNPTPQVPAAPTLEQLAERVARLEKIVSHICPERDPFD